jgi:hypothetical protein
MTPIVTNPATPDWLALRGGELRRGLDDYNWMALLDGSPIYRFFITPAKGKFTCVVKQSVNGKRIDQGAEYPAPAEALAGGLEELRQYLGW